MTTTEKIRDTVGATADRLKQVARSAVEKVRDLGHLVTEDMPNLATASRTVIIERTFDAPPDKLFSAWTERGLVATWWGPEGYTTTDIEMDLRVDGRWSNTMVSPTGKRYRSAGEFREVDRPRRLVMFDEGKGEPMHGHATKLEVRFERHGNGTKMHLVQGVFQTVEMRDECRAGWVESFDRLERMLARK